MRSISPFSASIIFLFVTPIHRIEASADGLAFTNTAVSSGPSNLLGTKTDIDENDLHQFSIDRQHRLSKRTRGRRRCPTCSCGSCNAAANSNAQGFMNAISSLYGETSNAFIGGLTMFGGVASGYGEMLPGHGPPGGFGQGGGNRQQMPPQTRGSSVSAVNSIAGKSSSIAGGSKGKPGRFSQLRDEHNLTPAEDTWGYLKGTHNSHDTLLSSAPPSKHTTGTSSTAIKPVFESHGSRVSGLQTNPATEVTNVFNQAIYNITNIQNNPNISIINIEDKSTLNLTNLLYQQSLNLTNESNENNLGFEKEDRYSLGGSDISASPNSTDVEKPRVAEDDGGREGESTGNATQEGGGCPEGYECI